MEIKVYNWEIYNRGILWYILFTLIIVFFIIFSLFFKNFLWLIIIGFLVGWYVFLNVLSRKIITIKILDKWLLIGSKFISWDKIVWFNIDENSGNINLLIFTDTDVFIHTIFEKDKSKLKEFLEFLEEYIPIIDLENQWIWIKIFRKLKI